jgi:transcriptional regulator with PAS, ATPase and Fis domain
MVLVHVDHGASKSTRHHVTVPIEEYRKVPIYILEIKEICEKHDEKYQMFCKSHECPCCRKCIIENHKECKEIDIIEDIIQDVKTSVSLEDLQQQLTVISNNIKCIRENFQNINGYLSVFFNWYCHVMSG